MIDFYLYIKGYIYKKISTIMKYNQFLEIEKILLEDNITIDDIKENHEVINEAISGIIGGGILLGLIALFNKTLLRWGVKKIYLSKLRKIKNNFLKNILETTSKFSKKTANIRQELVQKEKELSNKSSEESKAELEEIKQRKRQYDKKISSKVFNFIEKVSSLKTKQVNDRIDEIKKLKSSQKQGLKIYWEQLRLEIEIEAFGTLVKHGVITDPEVIKEFNAEFNIRKDDIKNELKTVGKKIKEEVDKDKEKEYEINLESINKNIEELGEEKNEYKEQKLKDKIILIIKDIKKLEEKEERNELYKKLSDMFGLDILKSLRKDLETTNKERIPQSSLKTDEL